MANRIHETEIFNPCIEHELCIQYCIFLASGALGVMFEYGIGVQKDREAAFKCLKEAAARGNVYAQGNLAVHYYRRKLLNKAADVAKRYPFKLLLPDVLYFNLTQCCAFPENKHTSPHARKRFSGDWEFSETQRRNIRV